AMDRGRAPHRDIPIFQPTAYFLPAPCDLRRSTCAPTLLAVRRVLLSLQIALQQDPRLVPVPLRGTLRGPDQLRNLSEGESTKELQVHELREAGIDGAEGLECLSDGLELISPLRLGGQLRRHRRDLESSAPLLRSATSHVVDEQAAHRARGICQ